MNRPIVALILIGLLSLFPASNASAGSSVDNGERLIHHLPTTDTFYMPLMAVVEAATHNHMVVDPAAFRWSESVLLAALAALLRPSGGLPAAAALLALRFLGGNMQSAGLDEEAPFALLVLLVAGLMAWRSRRPTLVKTFLLSVAIGVSLLYRSPLAFFPFVLAGFEAGTLGRRGARLAHWPHTLILCVVPYFFLIPWMRFNRVVHGEAVIFENHAADANIAAAALGGRAATMEGDWTYLLPVEKRAAAADGAIRWAAGEISAHPFRYIRGFFERIIWVISMHPLLWLLAMMAAWIFREEQEIRELGLLALYFTLIHCCMAIQPRYFEPLWPLLAALCGSLASPWAAQETRLAGFDEFLRRLARLSVLTALSAALAVCMYVEVLLIADARPSSSAPPVEQTLDDALRLYPRDAWLFGERGALRLQNGQWTGAAADLAAAAALRPLDSELQLKAAWAQALKGGKNWQNSSFINTPLKKIALVLRGAMLLRQGRISQAREDFSSAHKIRVFQAREDLKNEVNGSDPYRLQIESGDYAGFVGTIEHEWIRSLPPEERLRVMRELTRLDPLLQSRPGS